MYNLSSVAQSSLQRVLLRRELATGQLLLPGGHRLSRTQARARVVQRVGPGDHASSPSG